MATFLLDARHALRTLLKRPLFALVAASSLAIGIGATTALLGVAHVLLLEPLPGVTGWDRAVELGRSTGGSGFDTFSYPEVEALASEVPALEKVAAVRLAPFSVGTAEGGERVDGAYVSPAYFDALGVHPAEGRFFATEGPPGGEAPVVVVSDRFRREHLGDAADPVGQTVRINRRSFTVVGVTRPAFTGHVVALDIDLYLPLGAVTALGVQDPSTFDHRGSSWLQAVGRLADGATVEDADAQVSALFLRLQDDHPRFNRHRTASVLPLGPVPGGGRAGIVGFVGALTAMVVLVLLVTCSNVAGMFLARAASREREIAVRMALGSSRARMVRHLLVEAILVFLFGGIAGILLAHWGLEVLDVGALPVPIELSLDLRPEPGVLGLGLLVTLLTGLVFGLVPALHAVRTDLVRGLKADAGSGGRRTSRLRRVLASAQVGFSLVLLVASGLFLRALHGASEVDVGFEPEKAFATSLDLEIEGYDAETGRRFVTRLVERLETMPGVVAATVATDLPLDLGSRGTSIEVAGREEPLGVDFNQVAPGYVATLGLELLEGRDFMATDRAGAPEVALVSRTLAERVWPGESPIGKRFDFLLEGRPTVAVVGVVDDVFNQTPMEDPAPFVYRPIVQQYGSQVQVVVRSERSYDAVASSLRRAILDLDPDLSLTPVVRMERLTSLGLLPQRIGAAVATALGAVALFLSGLGVYGVVAFLVAGRTREIGVRMALGADASHVVRNVLVGGVALALPGLLVGGVAAAGVAHVLASQSVLLGVSPADPLVLIGVGSILLTVVVIASAVPARRAARVSPSRALRAE